MVFMSMKKIDRELPDGWKYNKVREELYCPHNVGHPVPWSDKVVHGCCGETCCDPDKDLGWTEAVETLIEFYDIDFDEDEEPDLDIGGGAAEEVLQFIKTVREEERQEHGFGVRAKADTLGRVMDELKESMKEGDNIE